MARPYNSFNFAVEIAGVTSAGFRECSGLESGNSVITYREGTDNSSYSRKYPGLMEAGNITLRRGITANNDLWLWRQKIEAGNYETQDISIVLYDDSNTKELRRWNLKNAWPARWSGPSLNASGNEPAVESLEIAHEGVKVQN